MKDNPADDASRGLNAQALVEHRRWIVGPAFQWKPEEEWPEQPPTFGEIPNEDPVAKKTMNTGLTTITESIPTVK